MYANVIVEYSNKSVDREFTYIIPNKYISELSQSLKKKSERYNAAPMSGWLALSPLAVFLGLYLVSSIIADDF